MVWLPRWGCDGMITSAQKLLMARAGVSFDPSFNIANLRLDQTFGDFVLRQDTDGRNVFFKPDGLSMYSGQDGAIYQYSLSSAWDPASAVYTGKSVAIPITRLNDAGLFFKPDGTMMFTTGPQFDNVHVFDLSTAWDLSTASQSSSATIGAPVTNPNSLFFKPDGTELYVYCSGTGEIHQFTLATPWDYSTRSFTASSTGVQNGALGLYFKDDGTIAYVIKSGRVYAYDLSTAWDISTVGSSSNFLLVNGATNSVHLGDNGNKLYAVFNDSNSVRTVRSWDLTTPWDVTTATKTLPSSNFDPRPTIASADQGIAFKPDGTMAFIQGGGAIHEYTLSSAFDLTTASHVDSFAVSGSQAHFSSDGLRFYTVGGTSVYQYSMSSAWDISTSSLVQTLDVSAQESGATGVALKDDGTVLYVSGSGTDQIHEYSLSTPWDISTNTFVSSTSITLFVTTRLVFKADGTKFWVGERSRLYQYALSTPWDSSTAVLEETNGDFTVLGYGPNSWAWGDTGNTMYFYSSVYYQYFKLVTA